MTSQYATGYISARYEQGQRVIGVTAELYDAYASGLTPVTRVAPVPPLSYKDAHVFIKDGRGFTNWPAPLKVERGTTVQIAGVSPELRDGLAKGLCAVGNEAIAAATAHKPMNSHHEAHSVILEELVEYWELVMLNPAKGLMWLPSKGMKIAPEQRKELLKKELTQTAAMCLRALHDLC